MKTARRASYWRCRGAEGSRKKCWQEVSSIAAGSGVRRLLVMMQPLRVIQRGGPGQKANASRGPKSLENQDRQNSPPPRRGKATTWEGAGHKDRQRQNASHRTPYLSRKRGSSEGRRVR